MLRSRPARLLIGKEWLSLWSWKRHTTSLYLRRAFYDVNTQLQTKFSQEPEPVDWEYYGKGIGSRLVDMYNSTIRSMMKLEGEGYLSYIIAKLTREAITNTGIETKPNRSKIDHLGRRFVGALKKGGRHIFGLGRGHAQEEKLDWFVGELKKGSRNIFGLGHGHTQEGSDPHYPI